MPPGASFKLYLSGRESNVKGGLMEREREKSSKKAPR
jgi:hypothetical protein